MSDKDGFLPAHIACIHGKSPAHLEILLAANPDALFAETGDGRTLLTLAKGTGKASKPNYELLRYIEVKMVAAGVVIPPSIVPPSAQTVDSEIDNPSFESCTQDLAKNPSGQNLEPETDNVETANLLLHLAGRFQNDASRRLVW